MPFPTLPRRAWCLFALLATGPAWALDWRVELGPEDALYPVVDLSLASDRAGAAGTFGGGSGLLQIDVKASRDRQRVHLRVESPHLARATEMEAMLPRAGTHYTLRPRLEWDSARLTGLRDSVDEPLALSLDADGETSATRRVTARLHPLDEALYFARDGVERVDLSWIFAAYADPRDAAVDALLANARAAHPELEFDGYATRDADAVVAQAFALWEALHSHGVRYAEEDPGVERGPKLWSQRVRRHSEVWAQRRANCLDGSLLLAAAAERLGLHAVLLLVPRHALLALHTRADGSAPVFVETTLLGTRREPAADDPGFVDKLDRHLDDTALGSFEAALAAGSARYRRESRHFGQHDPNYQWIDLATARAYGILPLSAAAAAPAPP